MRPVIKIILTLATLFASTFIIARLSGILTVESVTGFLAQAKEIDPSYLVALVILLLFSDLFIAVPTLSITLLSGHFLGFPLGSAASILGMLLAGLTGYLLSQKYGNRLLKRIIPTEKKRSEAISDYKKYGFAMILLSRVSPILPEVSACMAGLTGMKFSRFLTAWCLNTIPYGLIASYSGSISSLQNPKPAIYTVLGMYLILSLAWFVYKKYTKKILSV